jgi:acyl-CoA thioester hydrolase
MLGEDLACKRKRTRNDYVYHLEYRTRWFAIQWPIAIVGTVLIKYRSDNDVYDHMNNSVYSFLIDSIANAYLMEKCGMNPRSSKQVGLVVSSYCDYFGSVAYPSVLELGLRAVNLGKSSVKYEVGVFEKGKEDVRAVGGSVHVFVEQDGRRPAKDGMEPEMRSGLTRLLGDAVAKL